jgi:pimeloyl-ACP methyl ester carboxylesterase
MVAVTLNHSKEGNVTTAAAARPVEACLIDLFQHLGVDADHIAAGRLGVTDWAGLATRHADRVASLTLINPPILDAGQIRGLASRALVVTGDSGPTAEGASKLLADLPEVALHILRGLECHPWSDVIAIGGRKSVPRYRAFSMPIRPRLRR